MDTAMIVLTLLVPLFVLAFITKRRFGVLGLALAAGAMLSNLWAAKLTPLLEQAGVVSERPPLLTIVATILVLLPSALLLFSGPSYRTSRLRLFGAAGYAVLATVFLIEPVGSVFILTDQNREIYQWLLENRVYIVTFGLVIAVIDLLSLHTGFGDHPKRGRH